MSLLTLLSSMSGVASDTFDLTVGVPTGWTYTRSDAVYGYHDASGVPQVAATNTPPIGYKIDGSGPYFFVFPPSTNKCTNVNYGMTDLTGLTSGGNGSASVSVVNHPTGGFPCILIDNTLGGSGDAYVDVAGVTGNTNAHSASVHFRAATGDGTGVFVASSTGADQTFGKAADRGVVAAEGVVWGSADTMRFGCALGTKAYFYFNQLEETLQATHPIYVNGASASRAAHTLVCTDLATYFPAFSDTAGMAVLDAVWDAPELHASNDQYGFLFSEGTTLNNTIAMRLEASKAGQTRPNVRVATVTKTNDDVHQKPVRGHRFPMALAWDTTSVRAEAGVFRQRDDTLTGTPTGIDRVYLGGRPFNEQMGGGLISFTVYSATRTDAQIKDKMFPSSGDYNAILCGGQSLMEYRFRATGASGTPTYDNEGEREMVTIMDTYRPTKENWCINAANDGSALTGSSGDNYWLESSDLSDGPLMIEAKHKIDMIGAANIEAIDWDQGESDSNIGKDNFKTRTMTVLNGLRNYIIAQGGSAVPVFITRIGRRSDLENTDYNDVRKAQREMADENAYVYLQPEKFIWTLQDVVHLDGAGFGEHGKRCARKIYSVLGETVSGGVDGPRIIGFSRSGTLVTVNLLHDSGTDFTPTTGIEGFKYYDDGVEVTISSAVRTDATTITLTLGSTPTGVEELYYLYGSFYNGGTADKDNLIRDNGTLPMPLQSYYGSWTPFTNETETASYLTQAGVSTTDARKPWLNKLVKRLKDYGIWGKLDHFWLFAVEDGTDALIDLVNPASSVTNGGSTFTVDRGFIGAGIATGVSTDVEMYGCFMQDVAKTTADPMTGIRPKNSATNYMWYRGVPIGVTSKVDGRGFYCISHEGETAHAYRNGKLVGSTAKIAASGTFDIGAAGNTVAAAWCGSYLTEDEMRLFYAALGDYVEAAKYGVYDFQNAGIGDQVVTADVVVYGTTTQGIIAAYEAARQGQTVAICGGWRDRTIGGMTNSGLGHMDVVDIEAYGGLPRWLLTRTNSHMGRPSTNTDIECHLWRYALRELLDPAQNGGYSIPIYYSDGIKGASVNGTDITSIHTEDGRTFEASVFIDASYEGDLLHKSGVITVTKGREAAGSGDEQYSGFRGLATSASGDAAQFKIGSSYYDIDPYVIEGDPSSGLHPSISRSIEDCPANGTADDQIQAYCFRMFAATDTVNHVPFESTAPDDYDATFYEPLARLMVAHPTMVMTNVIGPDVLRTGITWDINSAGGMGFDYLGRSKDYPAATYAQREQIWKDHWNYQMGLWYWWQYSGDSRIPSAIATDSLTYGWHDMAYLDIHENDAVFTPPQLYVRECWRMVGDIVWTAEDLDVAEGGSFRSDKFIAMVSYTKDSHHTERLFDPNGGSPRIWNSGGLLVGNSQTNVPIPYDILVPAAAECTNVLSCFALSVTHIAMGGIRMEMCTNAVAQACGLAASLAISGATTVQAVDYATLAAALAASPSLSGETAPVTGSAALTAPVNTVLPVVSGTLIEGQTLSCTTGTWTGNPTPTYAYQWQRDGVDISGATSSTYTLVTADVGTVPTCEVTATNSQGSDMAESASIGTVSAASGYVPTDDVSVTFWGDVSALADGQVATWPNEVSGGVDAVQATSSLQPGKTGGLLVFGGDRMTIAEDFSAGVELTICMVMKPNITGSRMYVIDQSPGSTGMILRVEATTNKLAFYLFTNAGTITVTAPTALVDATEVAVGVRAKSGAIEIYVGGAANSDSSATTFASINSAAANDITIGADISGTDPYSGSLLDLVISHDTYLADADFNAAMNYVADNSSASWTDI